MDRKFVCAFRGRRDDYQIPVSLEEISKLEKLITDFYTPDVVANFFNNPLMHKRHQALLPSAKVQTLIADLVKIKFYKARGASENELFARLDKVYSRKAAEKAAKTNSDLFLYTPYAWEAFTTSYHHHPRKILFQYHPHAAMEREILLNDIQQYPEYHFNIDHLTDSGLNLTYTDRQRYEEVWKYSDDIICASSFTKNSLLKAGASSEILHVVPYGIDIEHEPPMGDLFDEFTFLFVGSGMQRKGLHILIEAWKGAGLYKHARLIIVSRYVEENIRKRIPNEMNITVLNHVGDTELKTLYQKSHFFVMPSLVEGFGQVFLEALAQGCPVLGTTNTCVPDLGSEGDGVYMVKPGDHAALADKLIYLRQHISIFEIRKRAFETAKRFTWGRFRKQIQSVVLNQTHRTKNR